MNAWPRITIEALRSVRSLRIGVSLALAGLTFLYRLEIGAHVDGVFQTADVTAPDAELRDTSRQLWLADLLSFSRLLGACVINQLYRTDDQWVAEIKLTGVAEAVVTTWHDTDGGDQAGIDPAFGL